MPHINWSYCSFNHYEWDYLYFYNYILPPVFNRLPVNVYVYLLIAGALFVVIDIKKGFKDPTRMVCCAAGGLALILLFQISWQQHYWQGEIRGKNSKEDKFFDFVLSHAPADSSCYAVSNTNRSYMRYILYPKILVIDNNMSSADCVLVFKMQDPLQYVPATFNRGLWYDRQSLMAFIGKR